MNDSAYLTGIQGWLDRRFVSLADWSLAHPRTVIVFSLLFLVLGFVGAAGVRQDNSMEAYFNAADTSYAAYKSYVKEFASDEVAYILYAAPDREEGIFDLEVMQGIQQLTEAIEAEVPFVRKVISLPNVEFIRAQGDDILIEDLLEDFPDSQAELSEKRALALSKPLYVGTLISADAQYGAIAVEMTRTSTDPLESLRLDPEAGDAMANLYPQAADNVLDAILARPEYAGIQFWVSGDVPMNAEYNEVIEAELGILTLSTFGMVVLVALLFIRSRWLAVVAPLGVVLLSLVLTVAFIGFLGWRINLMFLMVPPLLCAVGVAQALHVLIARQHQLENGAEPREAIRLAILKVGTPCLLAAVTTAIGFLGMSVSSLRAVHELAFYSAFGVMCAFFLSLTLLISLSARSGKATTAKPSSPSRMRGLLEAVIRINLRHPRKVLAIFAVLLAVAAIGLAWLRVDFNFLHEFKASNEWRQHTEKINNEMGGLLSVVYLFDTGEADGIRNPELLRHIEKLQGI
ncbi:MAG: MMPL family transporter, partial [Salinisphaeraceae bacterium]|nr:MMPL family transporter [Salinisphaeraceae bacterium]